MYKLRLRKPKKNERTEPHPAQFSAVNQIPTFIRTLCAQMVVIVIHKLMLRLLLRLRTLHQTFFPPKILFFVACVILSIFDEYYSGFESTKGFDFS